MDYGRQEVESLAALRRPSSCSEILHWETPLSLDQNSWLHPVVPDFDPSAHGGCPEVRDALDFATYFPVCPSLHLASSHSLLPDVHALTHRPGDANVDVYVSLPNRSSYFSRAPFLAFSRP